MPDSDSLAAIHAALVKEPWLTFAAAEAKVSAVARDTAIADARIAEQEWIAAGRPGGIDALYDGSWRDLEGDEAARRERDTLSGTIPDRTSGEIAAGLTASGNPFGDNRLGDFLRDSGSDLIPHQGRVGPR